MSEIQVICLPVLLGLVMFLGWIISELFGIIKNGGIRSGWDTEQYAKMTPEERYKFLWE